MGLVLPADPWRTPLDDDEKDGLLIPTITTRQELDEFEQLNVEDAIQWTCEWYRAFDAGKDMRVFSLEQITRYCMLT